MKKCNASIDSIESFSTKDGPGIRTVIFLNNCKLRCLFCHNPETWTMKDYNISVEEAYEKIMNFKNYFGKNGGVTFSGGEPLLQSKYIIELSKLLKNDGIHIALDTAGVGNGEYDKILKYVDLVILDIKDYREDGYIKMTGHSMDDFNVFLKVLNNTNKEVWLRQVIVPGINDSEEYILGLKEFIKKIKNVSNIELLPYHTMAIDKYKKLGIKYRLDGVPDMDKEKCLKLEQLLKEV